jgi:hypothetical protein
MVVEKHHKNHFILHNYSTEGHLWSEISVPPPLSSRPAPLLTHFPRSVWWKSRPSAFSLPSLAPQRRSGESALSPFGWRHLAAAAARKGKMRLNAQLAQPRLGRQR